MLCTKASRLAFEKIVAACLSYPDERLIIKIIAYRLQNEFVITSASLAY